MCQNMSVLPRAGGLLDQDSMFVDLMRHAMICQDQKRQLDEAKAQNERKIGG